VVIGIVALMAFVFIAIFAGPVTWWERRIAARMMSRIGPNRVGPQGVLQWLADGIKNFLKEDLVPAAADGPLFKFAPYLVFGGFMATFVVLPFGANLIAADLDVGLLYLLAITGLVVIGMLMAGWSSNNKWALFGGIRSAAQLVSYEIPSAFSLMAVVLAAGTMSMQGIIKAQGAWPWEWFLFRNPFLFVAFFTSLTSSIAEGNRTPFDLPEGESELVAGYHVEYSGMRFLWFMFAEWGNLWVLSSLATVCFLGGWQIPFVSPADIAASTGLAFWGWQALTFAVFATKASLLVAFVIQVRWTLPRLRVDQLMITCWKYLVPLALFCLSGVLVLLWAVEEKGALDWALRGVSMAAGLVLAVASIRKTRASYMADRDLYRRMEGKELWYPPFRLP
jgi:NADH-quinone oxidoreductase subunit H